MMISSWRRRIAARRARKEQQRNGNDGEMELIIPRDFRCPISLDMMKDPVILSTGITYDRDNIEKWIEAGNFTCPLTNQVLSSLEPIPNHVIRKRIQDWCVDNKSLGIERIPTPRVPVGSVEVSDILSKINVSCTKEDGEGCRNLVVKLKSMAKESERNRRCVINNGAATVLSETFKAFSRISLDQNVVVLEEILSALISMFPLDEEAKRFMGSTSAIHCLIWFLSSGDLSRRGNAVLALKELSTSDQNKVINELSEMEGAIEALFKLIKDPICPTATKASLTVIYNMISFSSSSSTNQNVVTKLVKLGLVSLLLETLVETERGICEKALGVLDGICNSEDGREIACNHALSMPVLVKKILRVSNVVTEFSVSILWKFCRNGNEGVLVEALQVGAFQKLLLLLQLGCVDNTKDRVSELLKLLNVHRNKVECVDPVDNFKDLKRPF